jgi:hypothetical protein
MKQPHARGTESDCNDPNRPKDALKIDCDGDRGRRRRCGRLLSVPGCYKRSFGIAKETQRPVKELVLGAWAITPEAAQNRREVGVSCDKVSAIATLAHCSVKCEAMQTKVKFISKWDGCSVKVFAGRAICDR